MTDQLDPGLVDERGRLQGVIGPLAPHAGSGQPMELFVDGRGDTRLRLSIAQLQLTKKVSQLSLVLVLLGHRHGLQDSPTGSIVPGRSESG